MTKFDSLHQCFIRELQPGARPPDPRASTIVSPCDGIVGEFGLIESGRLFQAKGFPYPLTDLLIDPLMSGRWMGGRFLTLRITSAMYHRFHAPANGTLTRVRYISGDTWNVNPIALKRIERLFCKNERAILEFELARDQRPLLMIPIAAILVASIRLHCLQVALNRLTIDGTRFEPYAPVTKGQELGWFEHGSTILVLAPCELSFDPCLRTGNIVRVGQPIFHC